MEGMFNIAEPACNYSEHCFSHRLDTRTKQSSAVFVTLVGLSGAGKPVCDNRST